MRLPIEKRVPKLLDFSAAKVRALVLTRDGDLV